MFFSLKDAEGAFHEGLPLAGVAAANDEFRFYVIYMRTGILDDPVIPFRRFFIPVNGNDGMTRYPGGEGYVRKGKNPGLFGDMPSKLVCMSPVSPMSFTPIFSAVRKSLFVVFTTVGAIREITQKDMLPFC